MVDKSILERWGYNEPKIDRKLADAFLLANLELAKIAEKYPNLISREEVQSLEVIRKGLKPRTPRLLG